MARNGAHLGRLAAAAALVLAATGAGAAWAKDGVFRNYDELRATLDPLMKQRRMSELLVEFGGADEYTPEQLKNLDGQMRNVYPQDFENAGVMLVREMQNGFRQEALAFWTGTSYVYAYMLLHQTADELVAINFQFNSDSKAILGNF